MVGLEDGESEFERLFFDRGALRPQVASRRAVRLGDNAGDFKIVLIEFPESGKGEFGSAEKNYIHKIIRLCLPAVGRRGRRPRQSKLCEIASSLALLATTSFTFLGLVSDKHAVEVVDLVLEDFGEKPFAFDEHRLTRFTVGFNFDAGRPFHLPEKTGN